MRTKQLIWLACIVAVGGLTMRGGASQAPDVSADYARSNGLNQLIANKMFDVAEAPNWVEGSQKFWYRKSVRGANAFQFVLVDPATASKAPAFDHARLATSMSAAAGGTYTATTLPFDAFTRRQPAGNRVRPCARRRRCWPRWCWWWRTCRRLPAAGVPPRNASAARGRAGCARGSRQLQRVCCRSRTGRGGRQGGQARAWRRIRTRVLHHQSFESRRTRNGSANSP
jgi:hypothetical protein